MVPITSAGSRSGVNWMRENAIRRHSATVRTASVFASPGTPSSRTCPPVSSPTSSRSTMTSWPTTRLATSRVIDWLSTASPVGVFAARVVIATPPPPPGSPHAPCLCCTIPAARALPAARRAATPRSPPPAPSRCAGAASPPVRRTAPGPRALPSHRAGRSPAATLPVPLRRAPAPAAGSGPCSTPGRHRPRPPARPPRAPTRSRPSRPASPDARSRARGSRRARDLASGDAGLEGRERVGARGGRAGGRGRWRPGVEHGPDPAAGAGARRRGTGRVAAGDRPARCDGSARGPGAVRRTGGDAAPAQRDGAGGGDRGVAARRAAGSARAAGIVQQRQGAGGAQGGGGGVAMTTRAAKTPTGDAVLSQSITREVAKRVVGQEVMVERLLVGLLTGGHVLLEGVPGLAKTLAVRTVAECLRIAFSRIQFTPDLLPADVIGTMVFDQKSQEFYPKKGPLFSNLVLADEINRAPAKVQSALLEAMQEKQVTIGGETFYLGEPFLVLATQNPIEQEGTYPLPEAQLDRFMLKVRVGYPSRDAEKEIVARMASGRPIEVQRVAQAEDILAARSAIAELFMDQKVVDYIVDVVRATREPQLVGLTELKPLIAFGASPRASIYLARAARAHAYLRGRSYVVPEDVKAIALDVLRHRVLLTFEAEAEDMDADRVIAKILEAVGVP